VAVFEFEIVKLRESGLASGVVPPLPNDFAIDGGSSTAKVAVAVLPVPSLLEDTALVVLV